MQNCLDFAKQLENAIPVVENLLFSTTAGDAVEACTFLGTAYQFGVPNAVSGVRKALFQVMSRDQSVRNNVATVYREIYLELNEPDQSSRQKALNSVNGLIDLLKGLEPGQSPALAQLITTWRETKALGAQEIQVNISFLSPARFIAEKIAKFNKFHCFFGSISIPRSCGKNSP